MLTMKPGARVSIDITPLTHLRSIQFELCNGRHVEIIQILSQISSVLLEDVAFQEHSIFDGENLHHCLEWGEVVTILQRSTFSRLRNVYFWQLQSWAPRTSVVQLLPRCAGRGILRVD